MLLSFLNDFFIFTSFEVFCLLSLILVMLFTERESMIERDRLLIVPTLIVEMKIILYWLREYIDRIYSPSSKFISFISFPRKTIFLPYHWISKS